MTEYDSDADVYDDWSTADNPYRAIESFSSGRLDARGEKMEDEAMLFEVRRSLLLTNTEGSHD